MITSHGLFSVRWWGQQIPLDLKYPKVLQHQSSSSRIQAATSAIYNIHRPFQLCFRYWYPIVSHMYIHGIHKCYLTSRYFPWDEYIRNVIWQQLRHSLGKLLYHISVRLEVYSKFGKLLSDTGTRLFSVSGMRKREKEIAYWLVHEKFTELSSLSLAPKAEWSGLQPRYILPIWDFGGGHSLV